MRRLIDAGQKCQQDLLRMKRTGTTVRRMRGYAAPTKLEFARNHCRRLWFTIFYTCFDSHWFRLRRMNLTERSRVVNDTP